MRIRLIITGKAENVPFSGKRSDDMKHFGIGISVIILFVMAVCLCSCGNSGIYNENDMLQYAVKHHGEGLDYSGSVVCGNETIAWFTANDEHPVSIALVFRQNNDGSYELSEDTNRFQSAGSCYILWRKGVAVHIENTDIKEVMICSESTETIPVIEYPFNVFYENERRSYRIYYLDADGNVISEL